jgi:hypothetical protein
MTAHCPGLKPAIWTPKWLNATSAARKKRYPPNIFQIQPEMPVDENVFDTLFKICARGQNRKS